MLTVKRAKRIRRVLTRIEELNRHVDDLLYGQIPAGVDVKTLVKLIACDVHAATWAIRQMPTDNVHFMSLFDRRREACRLARVRAESNQRTRETRQHARKEQLAKDKAARDAMPKRSAEVERLMAELSNLGKQIEELRNGPRSSKNE